MSLRSSLRLLLFVLLLTAAAAAFWWWHRQPPLVVGVRLQRGPVVEAVYATGTVEPVRWAKIASTETGRIVSYPVIEGKRVERGETLVRLDDELAKARLSELEARVRFLESDVERYTALLRNQNVSRQAYDRVISDLEQARAAVAAARERVDDLTIVSPLEGVVLHKAREIGEVVRPGDVLVWIGQDRPYWITAQVDEEDIPRVRPGQRTLIKADAFPERALGGTVAEITPKGDPINKQYRVRVMLPRDSPLMIGMTTEVNIIVREDPDSLLVPITALSGGAVFVIEEGVARRRELRLGVYGERRVEVIEGLGGDELLIDRPPPRLADGAVVRLAETR